MTSASSERASWAGLIAGGMAFALAHTQSLAWYSNQHQYLLHGLAARSATLARDWLANTLDPAPLFSALVAALPPAALHALFFALLVLYFIALMRIAARLPGAPPPLPLAALLILVHAGIVRWLSIRFTGEDYPWFLQAGVAGQYLLGPAIQPSVFGVLVLAAVAAFAGDHLFLTALGIICGCSLHATYLLPSAFLTLGFLLQLLRERRTRDAFALGLATLVGVLPVVAHGLSRFAATSPEQFAEAQRLFVEVRIPHHCVVDRWLDWLAWVQVGWMALGLFLLRRSRLFVPFAVAFALGLLLTIVQAVTLHPSLALVFPWRISVILVPIAATAVLSRVAGWMAGWPRGLFLGLIAVLAASGLWIMATGAAYRTSDDELPTLNFVRDQGPNDVYLLPVSMPKVGSGKRGVFSNSFKPPPRPDPRSNQIPVDLQRFRLYTQAPIYVDFKSVPYKDVELLEWRRRMAKCEEWYAKSPWDSALVDELKREGITRVIARARRPMSNDAMEEVYADAFYRIYRLR